MISHTWSSVRSLTKQSKKPYPPQPATVPDGAASRHALDLVVAWCRSQETAHGPAGDASHKVDEETLALIVLHDNPTLSVKQIAEKVGVSRSTLYRSKLFTQALAARKSGRKDRPQYRKSRGGADYDPA
jgi:hypothetical protein